MFYKEIQKLKKSELQELLAETLQQKATLERANASLVADLENLKMENKIHLREKQEAREIAENYSLSNNKLRNELEAEGSTPKNLYIHESNTIFADSGELHIQADDNKTVVFNCSTLVQDLATINDIVIKEAKRELYNNIQEIKSLTNDI